tara:strand:- start:592 stop:777 length:186 start_codon:yes stop_codon:yes gene_type:complete
MDAIITSENSPVYYNLVSRTMGLNSSQLDDFYRFFRVSGMGKQIFAAVIVEIEVDLLLQRC